MSAEQSAIELGVTFGAGGGISAEESAGEEEEEEGVPLSSVEVQQHSLRVKDFFFFPNIFYPRIHRDLCFGHEVLLLHLNSQACDL